MKTWKVVSGLLAFGLVQTLLFLYFISPAENALQDPKIGELNVHTQINPSPTLVTSPVTIPEQVPVIVQEKEQEQEREIEREQVQEQEIEPKQEQEQELEQEREQEREREQEHEHEQKHEPATAEQEPSKKGVDYRKLFREYKETYVPIEDYYVKK